VVEGEKNKKTKARLKTYNSSSPGIHDRYGIVGVVGYGVPLLGVSYSAFGADGKLDE
jgi:hypothetical protein